MEYKDGDVTSGIIAAAIEVHNNLGAGFPEVIYQRALSFESSQRGINAAAEADMPIH